MVEGISEGGWYVDTSGPYSKYYHVSKLGVEVEVGYYNDVFKLVDIYHNIPYKASTWQSINKPLQFFTLEEYDKAKGSGMLFEFYPNATGSFNLDCCTLQDAIVTTTPVQDIIKPAKGTTSAWAGQEGGDHYKKMGIQPLELTLKNRGYEGFAAACYCKINKYISRSKEDALVDLKKARHIIDLWIEVLEDENANV